MADTDEAYGSLEQEKAPAAHFQKDTYVAAVIIYLLFGWSYHSPGPD